MTTQLSLASPIVTIKKGKPVTTSQEVSSFFTKRHDDVLKKIRNLECSQEFTTRNFAVCHKNSELQNGKPQPYYEMTKDGFVFLVMGFTGKKAAAFKEAYIAEFNRMEKKVHQQSSTVIAPHRECLPKMVYHHRSKYNPYRAYVWDGKKSVYVGCFPTVDEAVAAQKRFMQNGGTQRIQNRRTEISDAEKEMFTSNLRGFCHNFRRIDEIWRSQLRPALEKIESPLVAKLWDRFDANKCILPTIEDRVGRYVPPKLPR